MPSPAFAFLSANEMTQKPPREPPDEIQEFASEKEKFRLDSILQKRNEFAFASSEDIDRGNNINLRYGNIDKRVLHNFYNGTKTWFEGEADYTAGESPGAVDSSTAEPLAVPQTQLLNPPSLELKKNPGK